MSAAEIALFSLSKFQLKTLKDKFRGAHRIIKKLLSDPTGVLITTLMLNEVINIVITTLIMGALSSYTTSESVARIPLLNRLPEWTLEIVVGTLVISPIILLFCEITPKVIAARANTIVAPFTAPLLSFLYALVSPVRIAVQIFLRLLMFFVPGKRKRGPLFDSITTEKLKEEDFLIFAEEALKEGNIQSTELELIKNVFDLDDTPVIEITTPLSRVVTVSSTVTVQQSISMVRDLTRGRKFSRIPITGKNKQDIVGILHSKDLLIAKFSENEDLKKPITELAWKPFTISQNTRLHSVFRKMRKQRVHMAVVTNEHAQAIGVVTLNDVLEALLAELMSDEEIRIEATSP